MINTDSTGRPLLQYDIVGEIRRIPIERRGTSASGHEWVLGGVLLEVFEEGGNGGSVPLYLTTWQEDIVETVNRIGVGKRVRVRYHIETREYHDSYRVSAIVDSIGGMDEGEDFLYGTKRKGYGDNA